MNRRACVTGILAVMIAAAAPTAQTGDARYAVAYVDVAPSGVGAANSAFKRYRDALARETGFVAFELFEQIGRPGHFVVYETWRDQAAFDAHQTAASFTGLKDALQPVRTSGYDQRPYKTLTVMDARGAAARSAVVVVTHVDIGGGGQVDVPGMLKQLADASRAEAGCLRFDVTQHTMRANHFTVVELWRDQEALDRHGSAAHTKQFRDAVQPVAGSPLDERTFKRAE